MFRTVSAYLIIFETAITILHSVAPAMAQSLPELPRVSIDTAYVAPTGATIHVPAGGDLQAALNSAAFGDTITLEPGASYVGPYALPNKAGSGWVIVRSATADSNLPPAGTRITPTYANVLPKIVSPATDGAIRTAAGAHHFRFIGVEFTVAASVTINYGIVLFGDSQTSLTQVPHHLILDRCYIHGQPTLHVVRGVQVNSADTSIIDSYISDIHGIGQDTQAIAGWNGPGPFKIVNNYLEAAGENLLFGGAYPSIPNLIASDIEIRRNHFFKPLTWKTDDPSYAGRPWQIKNLLELKNAQRVLIDGNVFEHNWPAAQSGFGMLLTPRAEGTPPSTPWITVSDITITNNVFRHLSAGINIYGRDDVGPTTPGRRILIQNNLFDDIGTSQWQVPGSFAGNLFMFAMGIADLTVQHNTSLQPANFLLTDIPALPNLNFIYTNNLHPSGSYGSTGSGTTGGSTLATYFPNSTFTRNALIGPWPTAGGLSPTSYDSYPGNFFPSSSASIGFVDLANGDYRLSASSPYRNAGTDGKDLGINVDDLNAAMNGTASLLTTTAEPTSSASWTSSSDAPSSSSTRGLSSGTANSPVTGPSTPITSGSGGISVPSTGLSSATPTTNPPTSSSSRPTTPTIASHAAASSIVPTSSSKAQSTVPTRTTQSSTLPLLGTATSILTTETMSRHSLAVTITSPSSEGVAVGTVRVAVTASPASAVTRLDYGVDGAVFAVSSPPRYGVPWDSTAYSDGAHILKVKAYDASGQTAETTMSVTSKNAPTVWTTTRTMNDNLRVFVHAAGHSHNLGSIEVYDDKILLGVISCVAASCRGAISSKLWHFSPGLHTITAVARNIAGLTGSSSTTVTVGSRQR